jgi:hypothetical protein
LLACCSSGNGDRVQIHSEKSMAGIWENVPIYTETSCVLLCGCPRNRQHANRANSSMDDMGIPPHLHGLVQQVQKGC